jgi:hypothetical protein
MTDPASRENWIDAPYPCAPPTDPPDDIDKALDALADAMARAGGGQRRTIASHLAHTPAVVSKTQNVLTRLPASRLAAFLQRQSGRDSEAPAALMPAIAAAGAADRTARAQLFLRLTMPARLYALQRACGAAARERAGERP